MNLQELLTPYLYTEAQEIDRWLRDSLRPYFGAKVDNPFEYKEIAKRFESGEFQFIHSIPEKTLILKRNGIAISTKQF